MTSVIVRKLRVEKRAKSARSSVKSKTVYKPNGQRMRILAIDANSPTFNDDLIVLFRRNVAKARRENKRLLGSLDGRKKLNKPKF